VVRAEQTVAGAAEVLGVVFNDAEADGKYGLRKLLPFG